jgi:tetratricopeptide (TPR) repeat protein
MQDLLVLVKPAPIPADGWKFTSAQAYRDAADALGRTGDELEIDALLGEGETQFPNDPLIYIRRSYGIMARDTEAAVGRWATCRLRFPEYTDGWIHGALLLEKSGQRDTGVALLDEALPRFESDVRILMARAYLARRQEKWDDALHFWQRVLEEAPENEEARREHRAAFLHVENA